jgi:hypothetical protein
VERSCEPMDKNRIEGGAEQGERAKDCEALVINAGRRKSGGCAVKECVLTSLDAQRQHDPRRSAHVISLVVAERREVVRHLQSLSLSERQALWQEGMNVSCGTNLATTTIDV